MQKSRNLFFQLSSLFVLLLSLSVALPKAWTRKRIGHYDQVIVFGDSLSDNGNTFEMTNGTWPSNPAYFNGAFSNGPVWVENFAHSFPSSLVNYAIGGATADNNPAQGYTCMGPYIPVPSALDQISSYLSTTSGQSHLSNLHVIEIGANDMFYNVTVDQVVERISRGVDELIRAGKTSIVLSSTIPLEELPIGKYMGPDTLHVWGNYSLNFRNAIRSSALQFRLHFVDFYGFFKEVLKNPDVYGFSRQFAYDSCLSGAYGESSNVTLCNNPEDYVFWDSYHPGAKMHSLMAKFALQSVLNNTNNVHGALLNHWRF